MIDSLQNKTRPTAEDVRLWTRRAEQKFQEQSEKMEALQRASSILEDITKDPRWLKAQDLFLRYMDLYRWLRSDSGTKQFYAVLMLRVWESEASEESEREQGAADDKFFSNLSAALQLRLRF